DPLSFTAGDQNLYRYVFNQPIDYLDPTGLDSLQQEAIQVESKSPGTIAWIIQSIGDPTLLGVAAAIIVGGAAVFGGSLVTGQAPPDIGCPTPVPPHFPRERPGPEKMPGQLKPPPGAVMPGRPSGAAGMPGMPGGAAGVQPAPRPTNLYPANIQA